MTGAMYSAVSGLKAHMNKLNVISNNVSNVNTYGFKAARTTFKESLYSTMRAGSNGTGSVGGVNPAQYGYGCNVGTIDLDMSTKNYVPTGGNLDAMISGTGFFMVGSKPTVDVATGTLSKVEPKDLNLTRVGNFTFDSQGYMVDGYGNVVYGFVTTASTVEAGDPPTIKQSETAGLADKLDPLVSTQLVPIRLPLALTKADYTGDSTSTEPLPLGTAIFPGINTTTNTNAYDLGLDPTSALTDGVTTVAVNVDSITIDAQTGKITATNNADTSDFVVGYIALAQVTNPNGVTHIQGPYFRAREGAGDCVATSIGGVLEGRFMNNAADGTNGDAVIHGTGETNLVTFGLESSGTDIATEFSEMITTQRGYQANTRVVTVTDSMLEELVNMKR